MKKLFLLLLLIIVINYAQASIELTRNIYGSDENFEGYLVVNASNVSLDSKLTGKIDSCGSYSQKETTLYNILSSSGDYSGKLYSYNISGAGSSSISTSGEKTYAFSLATTVSNFSFDVSDNSGKIKVDIGNDGYDWEYFGEASAWNSYVYSKTHETAFNGYAPNYETGESYNPKIKKCMDFEVNTQNLPKESKLRVNVVAKKTDNDDNSAIRVTVTDSNEKCDITNISSSSWSESSCELNIDLGNSTSTKILKNVCIQSVQDSNNGGFLIPKSPGKEYYFFSVNQPIYGAYGSSFSVNSNILKNEINEYYNLNCNPSSYCTIPIKIYGESGFTFKPSLKLFNNVITTSIYDINTQTLKYDLTGKKINLYYFEELRTLDRTGLCSLKINFLGKEYTKQFNLTSGPVAIISSSLLTSAKNVPITFDGTFSKGEVVTYSWDFGDKTSGTGKSVTHSYSQEGKYNVTLNITDKNGVKDESIISINVVNAETFLSNELSDKLDLVSSSSISFKNLNGTLKEFSNRKGLTETLSKSNGILNGLNSEFNSIKNNASLTLEQKETKYLTLVPDLIEVLTSTPKGIRRITSSDHLNIGLINPNEIVSFSKLSSVSDASSAKSKIYSFNQENVEGDYYYTLIKVDYLSGSTSYVYVKKEFKSTGGELVDSIGNYKDVEIYSQGCSLENSTKVVYCPNVGGNLVLEYSAVSDEIILTKGFIVPGSIYQGEEIKYQSDCESGSCDYGYCGDKICHISYGEDDSTNSNYCPQDCGKNVPWIWYITFGSIVLIGVFWINFYRGPGNFFEVSNKISYALFNKKLFMVKKDKEILIAYVKKALSESYKEDEIRVALIRKGWRNKQLDYVFNELKQKHL